MHYLFDFLRAQAAFKFALCTSVNNFPLFHGINPFSFAFKHPSFIASLSDCDRGLPLFHTISVLYFPCLAILILFLVSCESGLLFLLIRVITGGLYVPGPPSVLLFKLPVIKSFLPYQLI